MWLPVRIERDVGGASISDRRGPTNNFGTSETPSADFMGKRRDEISQIHILDSRRSGRRDDGW